MVSGSLLWRSDLDGRSSGGGGRLWLRLLWSRLVYLFHGRWSDVPTGSWRSRCGVLNSFYSGRASLVPSMVVLSTVWAFGSCCLALLMLLDAYICVVIATADGTSVRGLALSLVVVKTLAVITSQRFWVIGTCLEPTESSKVYVSRDWSSEGAEDGA